MTDEKNTNDQGVPTPPASDGIGAPSQPAAPVPPQSQPEQPPMGQQMPPHQPYQAPQPVYHPQPQPLYAPAPLAQLTGGMKFGWFAVGALLGIPGIIIAWLVNVDKLPQVKSDALKWTVIGFVAWIVIQFVLWMIIGGLFAAALAGAIGSFDPGSYGYHGVW